MKHRPWDWKLSYSHKIMLMTSLIILVVALLLSLFSWSSSSRLFMQMERELLTRNVESTHSQLNTALDTVQSLTTQIVRSQPLDALCDRQELSEASARYYDAQLASTIRTVISTSAASTTSAIQFINVYLKNGYTCGSLAKDYLPYQSFTDCVSAMQARGITSLDGYVPGCWFDDLSVQGSGISARCLVGMRFLYEDVTLEKIGVIVVGIKQSSLQNIFSTSSADMLMVRSDGTVISATQSKNIGETVENMEVLLAHVASGSTSAIASLPDGTESFIYRMAGGASWLVCPIDAGMLGSSEAAVQYSRQVVIISLLAVGLALLLSWFSSKNLTRSLVRLKGVVQKVYDGDLTARFQSDQNDEIAYLGVKINDMMEQVEAFFYVQEQDAAEKRNLELQLMQAQINPHLLYNTLNSVIWIIRQRDMEVAEQLILSLGSFFKLALSKGNEEVPLSDEISMIQFYLEIQNLGRGKAFLLHDCVKEQWRRFKLLRLTLQPLVENAVIHGFSDWRDDGEITISAEESADGTQLQVCVTDNGIGILPTELEALLEDLHAYPPSKEHKHYGLYNVERRIKNKYGRQYGMTIESEVGDYTRVILTLPLNKEEHHDGCDAH